MRRGDTLRDVTLTFVIHLLPTSVARGSLAGRLEVVSTGQVIPWGSGDELLTQLNLLQSQS
jgi:hypothetical protein